MRDYSDLTRRGQTRRLRTVALAALTRYDLDIASVRLVTDDTNAIFRVDATDGRRFALRVRTIRSGHGAEDIRTELAWLDALAGTDLDVVRVIPNRAGEGLTVEAAPGVPEPRPCVLFEWIGGPDLEERRTEANFERLGTLVARLHVHAADYTLPAGLAVRRHDNPFPYSNPGFECVEPRCVPHDPTLFTPARRRVYQDAIERVQEVVDRLWADAAPRVIHNDIHPWNVKVHRGRVHVFDFEDLMIGHPLHDVACSLYYVRVNEATELERSFRRGYETVAPWPETRVGDLDVLVAGRALILANYIASSEDAGYRERAPEYVKRIETRLRAWL